MAWLEYPDGTRVKFSSFPHDDAWLEIKHDWDLGWPAHYSEPGGMAVASDEKWFRKPNRAGLPTGRPYSEHVLARCHECLAPGEDPSSWCECRHGAESCLGPCWKYAHYPQHCPSPGKGLKEEIRRKNEVTGPTEDAADNWAEKNPMSFKIAIPGNPDRARVLTVHPNRSLPQGTTQWDRQLLRLALLEAVRKLDAVSDGPQKL